MKFAGVNTRHVPPAPAFAQWRIVPADEVADCGQWRSKGIGVHRTDQQTGNMKCFAAEMALDAIVGARESRRIFATLFECVKDWATLWVDSDEVDRRAAGRPAN